MEVSGKYSWAPAIAQGNVREKWAFGEKRDRKEQSWHLCILDQIASGTHK